MKIAIITRSMDPSRGGVEVYGRDLTRALVAAGHDVHVFATEWGDKDHGITRHTVPKARLRCLRNYVFAHRAVEAVKHESFDIVHAFGRALGMDIIQLHGGSHLVWMTQAVRAAGGGMASRIARFRQALSIGDRLRLKLEREQFDDENVYVAAISRMTRDEVMRFYGVPPERIGIVYNGVDLERFHPRNKDHYRADVRQELELGDDEVAMLFIGHSFKRKGLRPALKALARLAGASPPVRLLVLGGDRQSRFARLTRRLGCEHLVQYIGPSRQPERYYAAADVVLFPSYYDPFGSVTLEALASGVPVITSIHAGSSECITVGRNGYVIDPGDTPGLVASIRALLDPETRRRAGLAAREEAEKWPLSRNTEELLAFYDYVLERKRAARVG